MLTQAEFVEQAQQKLNAFVDRDIYRVCKLSEAESYVWGMVDSYAMMIPYQFQIEARNQIIADILSYIVVLDLPDDDSDVYPHGTEFLKPGSN